MAALQSHRIKGFDGIRAIAVSGVFLMHKTAIGERYQLGQYGVWLFFLLSGFLITAQLVAARERVQQGGETRRSELAGFWWRRSFRILPPYYLLLVILSVYYLLNHRLIPGLGWHFAYLTNWFVEFKAPGGNIGTWGHFWSLAIEEQFYLLFAPLVIFSPRKWAPWWCAFLLAVGIGRRIYMVETGWPAYAIYADSLVNIASLALGGLAGLIVKPRPLRSEWLGWVSLGAFLALPFLLGWAGWANGLSPLLALAIGLTTIVCVHGNQDGTLVKLLNWRPIAYFGRISYGFYLYESYPPAQIGARLMGHDSLAAEMVGAIFAFAASLLISVVSFELFEIPVQRLGRQLKIGRRTPEPA